MSYLVPIGNDFRKMWLIVEWKSTKNTHSGYHLVSSEELVDDLRFEDFHTGKLVNIKYNGGVRQACIVIVSADKDFLEMEIKHLQDAVQQIGLARRKSAPKETVKASVSPPLPTHPPQHAVDSEGDFVHSGSDWNPSSSDCDSETTIANISKKSAIFKSSHIMSKAKKLHDKKTLAKKLTQKVEKLSPHIISQIKDMRTSVSSTVNIQRNSIGYTGIQNMNICPQMLHLAEPKSYAEEQTHNKSNGQLRIIETPQPRKSEISQLRKIEIAIPPMTFDQQTQTSMSNSDYANITVLYDNQNQLNADIGHLHNIIERYGAKMESMQRTINALQNRGCPKTSSTEEEHDPFQTMEIDESMQSMNMSNCRTGSVLRNTNRYEGRRSSSASKRPGTPFANNYSPPTVPNQQRPPSPPVQGDTAASDMIPIGSGKTLIPRHTYNQIKWNSYSFATRKLLMSVFPRRTLATHSLTGKSSPAFSNKPAKMKLDSKKISDIIMTVSQMCRVQENLVRNIITTKCSDENKMYRMRMEKNKNKKLKEPEVDQENHSP